MILNNIGYHAHVADLFLCFKNTMLIFIRCKVSFGSIPSVKTFPENMAVKVKHGREISLIPNKILQFIILYIENFPNRKGIIRAERFLFHLP